VSDGGERQAQVAYRAAFDGLRRFFAGRGVPNEEAADLAQEALTRTFIHIKRHGRASEDLWPLLTTVARNIYADRGRRNAPVYVPLTQAAELADADPTPDDVVVRRERRDAVRAAVASLPARHRRAIELELRGMTPADIARELGIKRNAADALLHRARRSLASKLESMRGALGTLPFVLRLRLLARRASAALGRLDPTCAVTGAATGIVAVALVGALGASPGARHAANEASAPISSHRVLQNAVSHASGSGNTALAAHSVSHSSGPAKLVVTTVNRDRWGAHLRAANPSNPNQTDIGVDVWEQPNGRPSIVASALDRTTAEVCAGTAQVCGSSR